MSELLSLAQSASESLVEPLGWMLIHSLWQFTLMALVAAIALRAMRRRSASLRYAVLVTALGLSAAGPVATWILQPGIAPVRKDLQISPRRELATADSSVPSDVALPRDDEPILASNAPVARQVAEDTVSMVPPLASRPVSPVSTQPAGSIWSQAANLLRQWLGWIVAGWLVGVILGCARPLLGWYTLVRLRRVGVSAAPDELLVALERVSAKLGPRHAVPILQSSLARVPMVVGYLRPVILVPVSIATSIPVAQLEAILAHELAHVRRHDFLVNLLQTLVETLFFYHPAIWWLSSRIRVEREHCCDDLVVQLLDNRLEYGRALVALEEMGGRDRLFALGAADGSLLGRVRRILGAESGRLHSARSNNGPLCLSAICMLLVMMAIGVGMNTHAEQPPKEGADQRKTKTAEPNANAGSEKTDLYGDALPPGAIARLGTTRYRHPGGITSLHFLPDNRSVIGVGTESRLSVWEAETGKRLREISVAPLNIAGFALSRDGKQIAVGGYWWPDEVIKGPQGEVRVLDALTGGTIKSFPRESRDANHLGFVFSKDGKLLFSLGEEGVLRVEEVASGVEILQNKFPADNGPELALSPDGKTLAIVCGPNRRKFFLWDWQSGNEPRELKRTAAEGGGGRMVFSPSGRHVVFCGDRDEPLHVWDVASGKLVANLFLPDHDTSTSGFAVFSPDGKQLLVPAGKNQDWPVHVWNAETWKFERKLDIKTLRFALSDDGKFLSTGRRTFNLQTGQGVGGGEVGHNSEVSRVLFAPPGRAMSGSFDGTVRIWDLASGRQEKQLLHDFFIQGFGLSPDGQLLVSGSLDDTVRLWNVASGKEIYRLPGHGTRAGQTVAFMDEGKSFASFGGDYFVRIWDVRTGKALVENRIEPTGVKLPEEGEDPFAAGVFLDHVQFSARGKYLVLSFATKLHVFETATGKEIQVLEREGSSLAAMEISPDERQLLACSRGKLEAVKLPDGRMRHFTAKETIVSLWDLATGARLQTFKATDGARAAAFSPDGKQFAIASNRPKNQVAIYDLRGAEPRVVDDIPSRIYCLALGADGKLIVGLDDSSALIYDLNAPLKQ